MVMRLPIFNKEEKEMKDKKVKIMPEELKQEILEVLVNEVGGILDDEKFLEKGKHEIKVRLNVNEMKGKIEVSMK